MGFTLPAPEHDFGFDENTVEEYTHGDCWYLALALHRKLGLPVVAIWGDGEIQHVGVELSDGNVVDIQGVWKSSSWSAYWYEELDDCDDITCGDPSESDDNWCNAINTYSEEMLDQRVLGDPPTLGETANSVVDALRTLSLL